MSIKLGVKVKDKVTGFTGIAVTKVEHLNGCIQYCIKPPIDKDGKMVEGEWIDQQQLEVVVDEEPIDVPKKRTGGPVHTKYPKPFSMKG